MRELGKPKLQLSIYGYTDWFFFYHFHLHAGFSESREQQSPKAELQLMPRYMVRSVVPVVTVCFISFLTRRSASCLSSMVLVLSLIHISCGIPASPAWGFAALWAYGLSWSDRSRQGRGCISAWLRAVSYTHLVRYEISHSKVRAPQSFQLWQW